MLQQRVAKLIQNRMGAWPVSAAFILPGGQRVGARDTAVTLEFKQPSAALELARGRIGALGELFVEGAIDLHGSLRDLMSLAAALLSRSPTESPAGWWQALRAQARSLRLHTRQRDAAQVQFHYDVSDDFYALWLDPLRVYSCAYYAQGAPDLAAAQQAKLDHICRKLMLRPGERLLDIGAGWGGLLLWACEHYGVKATGVTLSKNQHAYLSRLIESKGLQGRASVRLLDYRDLDEREPFDKIASVGMFEHVGRAHMGTYFGKVARLLRPGGLVLNHGITAGGTEHTQLGAGMGDFIEKYIFPGGELLHVSVLLQNLAQAGLEMVDTENLRPHYARTLWDWSDALEGRLEQARTILQRSAGAAHADKTLRAYRLYLAGSAMSFERGWISLHQMLATRPSRDLQQGALRGAQSAYPFQRDYMYAP